MNNSGTVPSKKQSTGFQTAMKKINGFLGLFLTVIFRLRKLVMAAPVIFYAVKVASYNLTHLPEEVGLNLQSTGAFAITIARPLAVYGPLGLTAACLLLMFCSRKALYPWAVSIFTLALPLLILFSNLYPA